MPQVDTKVEEITVAEITGQRIGKDGNPYGPHHIKDNRGREWNVWKDRLEELKPQIGQTYAAMYEPKTYTNRYGKTFPDNTIVGLVPATPAGGITRVSAIAPVAPVDNRDENIAVLALGKIPELVALARQGDVATGVKVIRSLRLMWREAMKQAAIMPTGDPDEGDFNDKIPF